MSSPELKTYYGNCHCAAYKFSIKIPPLKDVTYCNCSVCAKKGYLWYPVEPENFIVERGDEGTLKLYEPLGRKREGEEKIVGHQFCPKCGTPVKGIGIFPEGILSGMNKVYLNMRTLRDIDMWALKLNCNGAATNPPAYEPPKFAGSLPAEEEGKKIYTGGCHCGKVTIAVKSVPLPEAHIHEDDCSICTRNAYTFVYPPVENVAVHGKEHLTEYRFDRGLVQHNFCSTCGVPMYEEILGPEEELLDKTRTQPVQEVIERVGVNVRVLDGVEWSKLTIEEERDDSGRPYVIN